MKKRANTNAQIVSIVAKRARKAVIAEVVDDVTKAQQQNLPRSGATDIIDNHKLIYPWLTKNMVYGSLRRLTIRNQKSIVRLGKSGFTSTSIIPCEPPIQNRRPKGSTISNKLENESKKEKAKDEIAILYQSEKEANGG